MPYQYDPLLDPDNEQNQEAPQLAGGSEVLGGASQTTGGAAPGAPTRSDRFQNLNDYITANEGSGFGNQFAGKVNDTVSQAGQVQAESGNKFKQQVDSNVISSDPNLVNQVKTSPVSVANDPNKTNEYLKEKNAQYGGPNSYADTQDLYQQSYGATKKATNTAEQAKTEPGRFALLDTYFGRPEYSQGQKSLDNLIVQGDQQAQQSLAQAAQNAQAYNQSFAQQGKDLSDYAAKGRGTTESTSKAAKDALGLDEMGQFGSGSQYNALMNYLNGQISQYGSNQSAQAAQTLANEGLSAGIRPTTDLNGSFGVDPYSYLNFTNPTLSNVSTPDQQRTLNALEKLAELNSTTFSANDGTPGFALNKSGYQNTIDTNKQSYLNSLDNIYKAYDDTFAQGTFSPEVERNAINQIKQLNQQYQISESGKEALGSSALDGLFQQGLRPGDPTRIKRGPGQKLPPGGYIPV